MILTAGNRRIEYPINSPQEAIEFAQAYATDPAALFDLVNCTIDGDGAPWVRSALMGLVRSLGNDSQDALIGIVNLIKNVDWIHASPHVFDVPRMDVPVFCVAPGPSLSKYIERLQDAQFKGLIIAADTAVKGLAQNGVMAHIATPVERDPELKNRVFGHYGITYGGSLYTEPEVNLQFGDHIVVPNDESIGRWVDERQIGYGSSTGTASIALGLALSSGPIYLVGHDISFGAVSHWSGASGPSAEANDTIEGNDGQTHHTNHWFKMFRDQISTMAVTNPRIFNVNIGERDGALIPGTLPCAWPDLGAADSFSWMLSHQSTSEYRRRLPWRMAMLPGDLNRCRDLIHRALTVEQLSCEVICGGDNIHIAESLFRPVYVQYSIEKRLGMSPSALFLGIRDAMLNVLDHSLPILTEVCNA